MTPTGKLSPTTRTGEPSPRLAPRALSWSADELAGVSGGGEEVGLEEHVNLVVRGLTRAVGLCTDETGSDAPSGFHAADVRQLLRTITRALQVTAAKLPLEYRKAVLDAAEKYLQCAIPLVSAIEQCDAEYAPPLPPGGC
jgi:ferric-dicitrate binding protein FerR (iron transport regulator)